MFKYSWLRRLNLWWWYEFTRVMTLSRLGYIHCWSDSKLWAVIFLLLLALCVLYTKHIYEFWSHTIILWSMWTLPFDILRDGVYQLCSSSFCYCLVCTTPASHLVPQEYNLSLYWLSHKIRPFVLECRSLIQISIHGSQCISWMIVMFKDIHIWTPVLVQYDIIHPLLRI